MPADWQRYCGCRDLEPERHIVRVTLPGRRVHRLSVVDEADAYRLTVVVVGASIVDRSEGLAVRMWERNRSTELVGFKIDAKSRLIAEAWVPKAGLTASEFRAYVHAVAAECDRLQYQLTGKHGQMVNV